MIYQYGFADVYDDLIQKDYSYSEYADYLSRIFLHFDSAPKLIADLGCGTGSLCLELASRGYDMIGIDASPDMLDLAQEKAAEAEASILFLKQRISNFELFGTVGAILSTIDSINYLLSIKSLSRLFQLVENYLDPGGLFIFDINTRYKLATVIGDNVFFDISDPVCYFWESHYHPQRHIATFDMTFFIQNEDLTYSRFDEIHRQRAHSHREIINASAKTALVFETIWNHLTFDAPTETSEKVCYVFRKPETAKLTKIHSATSIKKD